MPATFPKKQKTSGCSATTPRQRGAAAAWCRCTRATPMSARSAARATTARKVSPCTMCAIRKTEKGRRIPRAAGHALPQAAHCRRRSALRELGAARRRQGQERARRLFHFRRLDAGDAEADRLLRHAGLRTAPLRRRSQARARLHAQRRPGLEQARDLDARHPRPAQARGRSASGACRG